MVVLFDTFNMLHLGMLTLALTLCCPGKLYNFFCFDAFKNLFQCIGYCITSRTEIENEL